MSCTPVFEETGRRRFLRGVDCLAELVARTYGPCGRNIAVEHLGRKAAPLVTGSGREVARFVELADPIANMGVKALRDAATRVFDATGDGTSATVLMARRMIHEALLALRSGSRAIDLRDEMFQATATLIGDLMEGARPCTGERLARGVLRTAVRGAEEMVELLTTQLAEVGDARKLRLEPGQGAEDAVERVAGFEAAYGHASTQLSLPQGRSEVVLDNAWVLVVEGELSDAMDVVPALELARRSGRSLLVVASAVTGAALKTLSLNLCDGQVSCAAVSPPLSVDSAWDLLEDVATLTGAQLLPGARLFSGADDLGAAGRIVVKSEQTRFAQPAGHPEAILGRWREIVEALHASRGAVRSPSAVAHENERLEARARLLGGGSVTVRVGGASDLAMKERLGRLEAGLAALKSADEEGLVAGGGEALARAARRLWLDASPGARVVASGAGEPLRLLCASAGVPFDPAAWEAQPELGFDAREGRWTNLFEAGVVDSARCVRLSLQTAVGVAATVMNAAVMMVRVERPPEPEVAASSDVAATTREQFWTKEKPLVPGPGRVLVDATDRRIGR